MNSKRNMLAYDRSSTGLWVALIFLVSLNLRPTIAAVGPVLAQMGTDLAWGEGVQGVLTAIPLIAFAAVSPLVTFLARRIGIDMSILLALLCIAAGDAIRSFGGGVGIWLGTVVFASAIAVGNVLVPVIAKRDYAGHVAMATGVYSGCITAGSGHRRFAVRAACADVGRLACVTRLLECASAGCRRAVGVAYPAQSQSRYRFRRRHHRNQRYWRYR